MSEKNLPASLKKKMDESLVKMGSEFKRVLPKHLSTDRFLRIAQSEISKNPKLLECSQVSFLGSLMLSAQMGLEVGAHLGQSYLVPYKGECTLQLGYKGLLELVRRSNQVSSIKVENIFEKDTFSLDPLNNEITFRPYLDGDRGKHYLTVAVALMKDGTKHIDWMTIDQINKRRGVAQTRKVWDAWYERMAEKTVLKSLCRLLPISVEDQRLIAMEDRIVKELSSNVEDLADSSVSIYEQFPELSDVQQKSASIESVDAQPESEKVPENPAEALFD